MKKLLKKTGIILLSLFIIFYVLFLFVLPNVINLDKFMPDIKKLVAEQANLILDIENPKIVTTPLLDIGIQADKTAVKLPDTSEIARTDKMNVHISLPQLLFLTAKVTKAEIENPHINIEIVNGKEYKLLTALENITNNTTQIQDTVQTTKAPIIDPASIKIIVPKVKLTNYDIVINDLKSRNFLKLRGDELLLGYVNGEFASIKTFAEFFVNETKNITANIDVDTFIPKMESTDNAVETQEEQDIPFINPVAVYMAYDLKTNIDAKLKIREKDNQIISNGHLNIDDLTLNIGGIQLPNSKLHLITKGTTANIASDIFVTKNEKILLDAMVNYSKKPEMKMKIKSDDIQLDDILKLTKAALDSANIKNNIAELKGTGYFSADADFKTNFKKLESQGDITIYNCVVRNAKDNTKLARINSVLSLDNSILKFVDTYVEILDAVFRIDGTIDETSRADISVFMEKMPIQKLFNLFVPAEITKDYDIDSGNIDLTANLKGELKNAIADVNLSLKNLSLTDKKNNINYLNNILSVNLNSDFKTYNGEINNSDFKLMMNGTSLDCEKLIITVDDKNILIEPTEIKINNSTTINLSGDVKDYVDTPEFNIQANGDLITNDLKQFMGSDLSRYIKSKGSVPFIVSITGNNKMQTAKVALDANKDNYITFADIKELSNKDSVIQAIVELRNDSLKIKDTGLFIKDGTNIEEVLSIDGNITNLNTKTPSINLIKLKMPKEITATFAVFPKSALSTKGSLFISGDLNQPKIKGDLNISDMVIPEIFVNMKNATAKFENNELGVDISRLIANGSDFDILMSADLSNLQNITVKTLNLKSNLTDADKLMEVADITMKYTTPASSSNHSQTSANNACVNIPVTIRDGNIDIKQIKTGSIILKDTTGKMSLTNNILYLNNLLTTGFKGRISGNVSMNLISSEIKADVKGSGLDVEQTLFEAASMKDTLTGTMDFDANISLKGATYEEQVSSLNGDVNFTMKDGSLGPMGKLENLVAADNVKNISLLSNVVGTALKSTVDTSKFNTLKGHLTFNNGIAQINPITSAGDYMSAYIFGNFDVQKNSADLKLRGRLGTKATDSLGQLAMLNPVNVVKNSSGINVVLGQLLLKMCEAVSVDELSQIPAIAKESSGETSAKFQVIIRGDVAQPAKLVRSFKWLALESEINDAKTALDVTGTITIPTSKEEVKQQAQQLLKGLLAPASVENENSQNSEQTEETSLKERLKQSQKNTWEQLKEQAKQSITIITPETTD